MSFDKNHESPDRIVDPHKRTTKVNFGVVVGVIVFFVAMGIFVWNVAQDPPQSPSEATSLPVQNGK